MMRRFWLTRLLVLLASSGCAGAALCADAYLRIDGRYYVIDQATNAIELQMATGLWQIKSSALDNCRRSNGLPPQVGLHGVVALPSYAAVYTSADIQSTSTQPLILTVVTPSGDVICDGSVTGPIFPPQVLFANGFD